ncbi:hypothetical protein IWW57_004029, partial [Coemansia sp. S610]
PGNAKALEDAVAELESDVEAAVRKAQALHESVRTEPGKANRADFLGSLNLIAQDLGRHFAGSWRDNVRCCIVALASGVSAGALQPPAGGSPLSSSSGGSAGFPRISDEQKAMIRKHYAQREEKLAARLLAEGRGREEAVRVEFMREKSVLVSECRYLRAKIQIGADRQRSVEYQNTVFLQLFGGHDGLLRVIDRLPVRREQTGCRLACRRVLFAVRLKNRLAESLARTREADAIKNRALKCRDQNGRQVGGKKALEVQQIVGLRTAPITPSRLRNRSSELRSSSGSSYTQ